MKVDLSKRKKPIEQSDRVKNREEVAEVLSEPPDEVVKRLGFGRPG